MGEENEEFDLDGAIEDVASSMKEGAEEVVDIPDAKEPALEAEEISENPETITEPSDTEPPDDRAPPKSWAKEQHEHWAKLPKEAQDYISLREKQMLDGLEQYRGEAGFGKAMRDVIQPYQEVIRATGVDAPEAVKALLNAHYKLSSGTEYERQAFLDEIAQNYGLQRDAEQTTPEYVAINQEVMRLRNMVEQQARSGQEAARIKVEREIEAFASKHQHFDEVADDIIAHLQAGADLDTAYEKALWANPTTRQREIDRVRKESENKLMERKTAEAAAARKATAANVRSRDTAGTPTEPLGTMEDTMNNALKEIRERVS